MIINEPESEVKGKQAFVTRQQPQLNEVCELYGRDSAKCCIKVFYGNPMKEEDTLKTALWGDMPLPPPSDTRKNTTVFAGTQVQNILWTKGISPRVYGIFEAEYQGMRVACQLTEFVEGECASKIEEVYKVWEVTEAVGKEYGFTAQTKKMGVNDVIGGKNVDPQLWAWDRRPYSEVVKEIYFTKGIYGKVYYQNDNELGLHGGPRKSEERIGYMQLDKINFQGKVVWDLGCAGGYFLRYAMKRGAKRAIGFDTKDTLEAAFHAGNLLGYFNIDYIETDLSKGLPTEGISQADIVFFLSMNRHISFPNQLFDVPLVILEDNTEETKRLDSPGEPWVSRFSRVELVGRAHDQGDCLKPCYFLWK